MDMQKINPVHIPSDGYIILPISMSRSNNSQSALDCYNILKDCQALCKDATTIDVVVLYTATLYYSASGVTAWDAKRRLISQMISHKAALEKIIRTHGDLKFAIHFMSWEEVVLRTPDYQQHYQKLLHSIRTDKNLYNLAVYSIGNREVSDASISFLVEETVIAHNMRQKRVPLPMSPAQKDTFRLIVYPGPYIAIDLYQWKHNLLPQKATSLFCDSHYNAATKELYAFNEMPLPSGEEWQRELRHESE